MRKKIRVAILFGGKSAEHDVSLRSAKNVIEAMDKNKYETVLIGIDKMGKWLPTNISALLLEGKVPVDQSNTESVSLVPQENGRIVNTDGSMIGSTVDVVFPILHGPFGEDGTVQGLLKLANVPFVGAGVLGSAVGMDKDVMKRLLRDADIPVANFLVYKKYQRKNIAFKDIQKELGLPFFIKPANLGSSVGISKVHNEDEFEQAVAMAFNFDNKIIIEEFIEGREIECSVLGNEEPKVSIPGEIVPQHEFYSYDAKYIDEHGATLKIPAELSEKLVKEIQSIALKAFDILCCEGMARVDLFLTKDGKIFINEINTIPGFTSISMYPKLWEESGITYSELIDTLIQLAIERFNDEALLTTSFTK